MKRLLAMLLSPLVLGTLALLVFSALVWWIGPLVAIGQWRPLDGWVARAVVLAVAWVLWLGWLGARAWRRRRTNAALVAGIAGGPSASEREAQLLAQRFDQAVQRLRAAGDKGVMARLAGGGEYLYELPWYVFVGAPGSGKTTALLNAGLQFLLGDAQNAAVPGVGGTRHCDWWFTKDAVLIDTAGRYATQDSDREVDAAAWDRFLALLKKTRPRQPINGVLLTVNVQDLLQQGVPERAEHAARLRARLQELYAKLGVRAPVYVLVTKADLIGGFVESFEAMPEDERRQVFGFTFDAAATAADPLAGFAPGFDGLQRRLAEQLMPRMDAERDVARRAAIFAFPQELAALKPLLADFLRQVFAEGGQLERVPRVRGVYFTSGTQEGSPIDRVMGAMGRSFGMAARGGAAPGAPLPGGRGRSYFLHRLLKDVVFAEAGLGVVDPAAERRRRLLRAAAAGAMAVAGLAVVGGWILSAVNNLGHAEQVTARVPEIAQAVAGLPPPVSADVAPLPAVLARVRGAARLEAFPIDDPPWTHGLGLYQGEQLDAAARQAHERLLRKALAPRVARRVEERLRASGRDNLEDAYESLKAYLMLHDPERFDAQALRSWVLVDWDLQYERMDADTRAELDRQLDAMLALGAPAGLPPRDDALVAGAREMLAAFPLEFRVFSRIRRQYRSGDVPDFSVAGAAGPNAAQVFVRASGEPLTRGIPGLYTKAGYERLVKPAIQRLAQQLAQEQGWVLGQASDAGQLRELATGSALVDKVKRLYLQAYIAQWDALLADVKLVPLTGLDRSLAVSRLLAAPDSPLAAWTRAVAEQTRLVPPPSQPGTIDQAAAAARAEAARLAGGPAPAADAAGPVERLVDDHFAALHRQVNGQPAPIDDTLRLFGELAGQLAAVDAARRAGTPPPPGGGGAARSAAATLPPPLGGMLAQLADATANQGQAAERSALSTELKPIADFCARAIRGRYPFASGSRADVLPDDFGQLFGQGGLMDDFFQRRLAPLVDISRNPWVYRAVDGGRPVSASALADFQRAQRIRDVFFRAGGRAPALRFELRLSEIEPSLGELVIDIDGQVQRLTTGSPSITIAWPPARTASVLRIRTGLGERGPLIMEQGPWALFRVFDTFDVQPGTVPERFSVVMNLDGRRARLEVFAPSVFNPFRLREIAQFRCPQAL